jgi:hypothetical protein
MSIADLAAYDIASAMIGSGDVGQTVVYEGVSVSADFAPDDQNTEKSDRKSSDNIVDSGTLYISKSDVTLPVYGDEVVIDSDTWTVTKVVINGYYGWKLRVAKNVRRML